MDGVVCACVGARLSRRRFSAADTQARKQIGDGDAQVREQTLDSRCMGHRIAVCFFIQILDFEPFSEYRNNARVPLNGQQGAQNTINELATNATKEVTIRPARALALRLAV